MNALGSVNEHHQMQLFNPVCITTLDQKNKGFFTVGRALPWPPNKHFLQVSQSRNANLIDRQASIKSFITQLPNENLSILTDKVEAKAQQLYKT